MKNIKEISVTLGYTEEFLYSLVDDFSNLIKKRTKRKKSNPEEFRKYLAPEKKLKVAQKRIKKRILNNYIMPKYIKGLGGKQNSHVNNAKIHAANHQLVGLDITNFYDNISETKVVSMFKTDFNFNKDSSRILASLTTFEGRLWQGLPTSSHIAFICSRDFSDELDKYAKQNSLTFSQYGDDLFFSAKSLDASKISSFVIGTARRYNLKVNRKKTKVDKSGIRKVTGSLSGNSAVRAPKHLRKQAELKARMYYKYGNEDVKDSLRGLLLFIKQANPKDANKIVKKYNIKLFEKSNKK